MLDDISGFTYSLYSDYFLIHVPKEYDYLILSRYRNEIIEKIMMIQFRKGVKKMRFSFVEDINLMKYC